MDERREEDALSRVLLIALGGEAHRLRTLTVAESDEWLGKVSDEVAGVDIPEIGRIEGTAGEAFARFLTESAAGALRLIVAYDLDDTLGGADAIRSTASKRELRAALERMVEAEDPFGEDAVRSVAAAFGEPSRSLWRMVALIVGATASRLEASTDGQQADTASAGPSSEPAGAGSSSSSDGPTPITRKPRKRKSA